MWNFYDIIESNSFDKDLINKTNNPSESFNNKLNAQFPTNDGRPSMTNFVEGIRKLCLEYKAILELSHRGQRGRGRAHKEPDYYKIPEDYTTYHPLQADRTRNSQRK